MTAYATPSTHTIRVRISNEGWWPRDVPKERASVWWADVEHLPPVVKRERLRGAPIPAKMMKREKFVR